MRTYHESTNLDPREGFEWPEESEGEWIPECAN
jgi:hypothetical protein